MYIFYKNYDRFQVVEFEKREEKGKEEEEIEINSIYFTSICKKKTPCKIFVF